MKRPAIVCLLVFFLSSLASYSQEEFVMPQSKSLTKFKFAQLSGGIIILRAQLDNIPDTLNFVLDTGSGGISLDSSTVEEFKIPKEKSDRTIRGIAGMKTVDFAYHHSLRLPGLKVDSLDFHINDYDLLTSVYGVKIDGIICFSFLRRYIVRIDYDDFTIEVLSPGTIKYPRGGYVLRPNFSTLPLQSANITDDRQVFSRFIFDTGAGLCALLSQDFVDDSDFISKRRKIFPTQAEGLGGKKLMNTTVLKGLNVGPYHFKNVPIYIFKDEFNVTSYPQLGGLIGNDIFRRFNIILNYPEQVIHLKPNFHYADNFDYSYTGLGIYMVNGEITVIDIIKGSPGEKAGFKPDDTIYAIDNSLTTDIQTFKTLLQNAGSKVKIVVSRNKKLLTLNMVIRDIRK